MLEAGIHRLAHVLALDIDLDAPGAVLQRAKTGLSHDPFEHHAPGYLGQAALGQQILAGLAAMGCKESLGAVGGFEIIGKCHPRALRLQLAQRPELLSALQHQLVVIFWSDGGVRVRQGGEVHGGLNRCGCLGIRQTSWAAGVRAEQGLAAGQALSKALILSAAGRAAGPPLRRCLAMMRTILRCRPCFIRSLLCCSTFLVVCSAALACCVCTCSSSEFRCRRALEIRSAGWCSPSRIGWCCRCVVCCLP